MFIFLDNRVMSILLNSLKFDILSLVTIRLILTFWWSIVAVGRQLYMHCGEHYRLRQLFVSKLI